MHDTFSIRHKGQTYLGRRYLRLDHGRTYQTVFYLNLARCDPADTHAQGAQDHGNEQLEHAEFTASP